MGEGSLYDVTSCPGGLCPRGSLSGGGGLCPGRSPYRGGGSLFREVSVQGVSVQGDTPPPTQYGKERAVRILLERILVLMLLF